VDAFLAPVESEFTRVTEQLEQLQAKAAHCAEHHG
jgi:hypothetical protein